MTSADTAALVNRTESYNSETGSFWNMSASETERESVDEEVLPLGNVLQRAHRRHPPRPEPEVQSLKVHHVIGFSKDCSSTPIAFLADDLVAYIAGCFVTLYDLRSNCQVQHLSLESRKRAFSCLAISDNANILAAGESGHDPSVVIWPLENGLVGSPVELKGHRETITAMGFSPNGKYLATVGNSQDAQLFLWDCQMETVLCSQLIHNQANLTSLSFSMDSKVLYTSGKSHFTMWNISQKTGKGGASSSGVSLSSKPALPSSEKVSDVVDVKASGSGKSSFLFALTKNGILYKLRFHKGGINIEKKLDLRVTNAFSLAVGVNNIAVSCSSGVVKIVRSKNLTVEATVTKPNDHDNSDSAPDALYCAFDENCSSLAVAYADNSVAFWDAEDTSVMRCYHTLQSHSGCISDIFSIPSASSNQKALDRNRIMAMRSPNIHNPQAIESEFATCSDKGTISLWNLKIQKSHSQHVHISPTSEQPSNIHLSHQHDIGLTASSNPHVEIETKTVSVNPKPPAQKAKLATRRSKGSMTNTKSSKEPRQSLGSKPASVKKTKKPSTRAVVGSSLANRAAPKIKAPSTRSAQRGKRVMGTPGPMRLSTELTSSTIMQAPVVVHKRGASKASIGDVESCRAVPLEDTHLTCIRVSPNGLYLVVGDDKGVLRVYHLASMKLMTKKTLHQSAITTIEFSLTGNHGELLLATGTQDGSVSVIEVHNDFKIKLEKEDHTEPVTGLAFTPEGKAVVSCGRDNYLYYESLTQEDFDNEEEDMELFLSRHFLMTSTFEAMHFNAKQDTYMLACSDNFIRIFNGNGQFVHTIHVPAEFGAPTKILEGPIPSMIITCHANNAICIFEYFTGRLLATGTGHTKTTGAVLINNGRNLITTGADGVMVIWELSEKLCQRCMRLPMELGIPQKEAGYANEFFFQIQREKERALEVESDYCCPDDRSSNRCLDRMASFEQSLPSGTSTPQLSCSESRLDTGLPMVSPVGEPSRPISMPNKDHIRLPSWMSKVDGLSDNGLLDGFDSASPSIYSRPPRLDLGGLSDTDDESVALPVQISRGPSLCNARFSDLDSLPVDDFLAGHGSRRRLSFEHDRFSRPVDSMRWGHRSKESSPAYGFHPCSSLAQYQDDEAAFRHRRNESFMDMGFGRPTGPEPPSSCASDSRNSSPLCNLPVSCFDPEAMMRQLRESWDDPDDQFVIVRSPYSTGRPIGPNVHRIASRTPQSVYSDDKTVYTRPNSEEHTSKMLAEFRASDDSVSPIPSPFATDARNIHWSGVYEEEHEDDIAYIDDLESDRSIMFICPTERADTPIAEEGGHMNKNPLYSSGSEETEFVGRYRTRPMGHSIASAADLRFLEKDLSFNDMPELLEPSTSATMESDGPIRKSMDTFWKTIRSSVIDSLKKLKEDIGQHEAMTDLKLPTSRKQAYVEETQSELAAFLDALQSKQLSRGKRASIDLESSKLQYDEFRKGGKMDGASMELVDLLERSQGQI